MKNLNRYEILHPNTRKIIEREVSEKEEECIAKNLRTWFSMNTFGLFRAAKKNFHKKSACDVIGFAQNSYYKYLIEYTKI